MAASLGVLHQSRKIASVPIQTVGFELENLSRVISQNSVLLACLSH